MSSKADKTKIIASGTWPIKVDYGVRTRIAKETDVTLVTVRLALGGFAKTPTSRRIRRLAMTKYNGYCPDYESKQSAVNQASEC